MAQAPASRWQRKKDARPSEILDAALTLFVEKGFSATKMEDIARAAGVTKGTPYLYFQNKEEIFKAMVRHHLSSRLSAFVDWNNNIRGRWASCCKSSCSSGGMKWAPRPPPACASWP
ncbi:TetR/AcrR family transcriptional regulator [Chromobacterium haemolyticum]|uniref:TetR/AcrR family transcriptional regulator n=1 Tax=Chromobacterium haemolyticum TaxID=394935 RepID=UPI001F0837A8|nr:helix-turn-helix domain-containing protein [Chromobacterium haemolyticum]